MGKQAYKFELYINQQLYDILNILLLKQDITNNGQVSMFLEIKIDVRKGKEYEIEAVRNIVVYKKAIEDKLSGFYSPVLL